MSNVQSKGRGRKVRTSKVGAVGVVPHGTPGDEHGSPHGSNPRIAVLPIDGGDDGFDVVLAEDVGPLRLLHLTVLVAGCLSLEDAQEEQRLWCEGMGIRAGNTGASTNVEVADPVAGWPFR